MKAVEFRAVGGMARESHLRRCQWGERGCFPDLGAGGFGRGRQPCSTHNDSSTAAPPAGLGANISCGVQGKSVAAPSMWVLLVASLPVLNRAKSQLGADAPRTQQQWARLGGGAPPCPC